MCDQHIFTVVDSRMRRPGEHRASAVFRGDCTWFAAPRERLNAAKAVTFVAPSEGVCCVQLVTFRAVVAEVTAAAGLAVPPSLGHVPQGVQHFCLGPQGNLNVRFRVWGVDSVLSVAVLVSG